jgi:hypothetical protein
MLGGGRRSHVRRAATPRSRQESKMMGGHAPLEKAKLDDHDGWQAHDDDGGMEGGWRAGTYPL